MPHRAWFNTGQSKKLTKGLERSNSLAKVALI